MSIQLSRYRAALAVVMPILSTQVLASSEPSESEMRGAIERRLAAQVQSMRQQTQSSCDNANGNPGDALTCLWYSGTGAADKVSQTSIAYFKKIACEKNNSSPGYNCDYLIKLVVPGMGAGINSAGASSVTRRFVQTGNGWTMLER